MVYQISLGRQVFEKYQVRWFGLSNIFLYFIEREIILSTFIGLCKHIKRAQIIAITDGALLIALMLIR